MSDDFRWREVRCFDIEVSFDNLEIGGDSSEEVIGCIIREVSKTEDLADLARYQELLELLLIA